MQRYPALSRFFAALSSLCALFLNTVGAVLFLIYWGVQ